MTKEELQAAYENWLNETYPRTPQVIDAFLAGYTLAMTEMSAKIDQIKFE